MSSSPKTPISFSKVLKEIETSKGSKLYSVFFSLVITSGIYFMCDAVICKILFTNKKSILTPNQDELPQSKFTLSKLCFLLVIFCSTGVAPQRDTGTRNKFI